MTAPVERERYRQWARLIAKVFEGDPLRRRCGGAMRHRLHPAPRRDPQDPRTPAPHLDLIAFGPGEPGDKRIRTFQNPIRLDEDGSAAARISERLEALLVTLFEMSSQKQGSSGDGFHRVYDRRRAGRCAAARRHRSGRHRSGAKERQMVLRALCPVLFVLSLFPQAPAQQERLSLDELVAEALESNPEILAARLRYEAASQRPDREASLPDPVLTPGYSSTGQPWPVAGLGTWVTSHVGATLSQEFPSPGKRRLIGGIARKEAEAELQEYERVRSSVVSRLKAAYHGLQYAYASTDVLTRGRDLLRKVRRRIEAPYFVGDAAQRAQISIFETRLLRLDREKKSRQAEINKLRQRPLESQVPLPEEMSAPQFQATLDELVAHARWKAPLLQREQKMVERSEFALLLARKQSQPDYEVAAGYFDMGGMPSLYDVRVSIRLPVYFSRKQARGVAEHRYKLDQAHSSYDAVWQDLLLEIKEEYLRAQTAVQLTATYASTVIPETNQALESYLAAYEAGTVDFMSVQTALLSAVESELDYYDQVLDLHLAVARLAELTGAPPGWGGERIGEEDEPHENP